MLNQMGKITVKSISVSGCNTIKCGKVQGEGVNIYARYCIAMYRIGKFWFW